MAVKKGEAFAIVHFTLAIMACGSVLLNMASEIWPALITGMVANATVFIGGNVTDNTMKGKYFNEGLNKEEQ